MFVETVVPLLLLSQSILQRVLERLVGSVLGVIELKVAVLVQMLHRRALTWVDEGKFTLDDSLSVL